MLASVLERAEEHHGRVPAVVRVLLVLRRRIARLARLQRLQRPRRLGAGGAARPGREGRAIGLLREESDVSLWPLLAHDGLQVRAKQCSVELQEVRKVSRVLQHARLLEEGDGVLPLRGE